MSAALKATAILSSVAVATAGAAFALRTPSTEFSNSALAAAEHGIHEVTAAVKPKLPSTFIQFTLGDYKWSNARA
ncbi:hypothetical protein LTR36_001579 [Oleoguttula mirabilis]|uniref:Uncharacterized protein n=1 Tax=Oleoguttula mirabilis TaxID=1507867 RepID=A0AAV9JNA2_9PEZI|nr:hypothetical protein LTR36_001579 [Oleoguttula mirabilis]